MLWRAITRIPGGFVLALICALASGPALGADTGEPIPGKWQATEFDPLFPDNDLLGQFRYHMLISPLGKGYRISVPRTGTRMIGRIGRDGSLRATGQDPTRGAVVMTLIFKGESFAGFIDVGGQRRKMTGEVDAQQRAEAKEARLRELEQKATKVDAAHDALRIERDQLLDRLAEMQTVRQERDDLRLRLAVLDGRLQKIEADRAGEQQAREQLEREAARLTAALNEARAGGGGEAKSLIQRVPDPPPSIAVIDPPVTDGILRAPGDAPEIIGKVTLVGELVALRLNGREVAMMANGIFRARLPRTEPPEFEIVAIDANGRRGALRFTVRPPSGPEATTIAVADPGSGIEQRCYDLAIRDDSPGEDALLACQSAVKTDPNRALNHYHLGVVLSRLGRHQEALVSYQEAAGRWTR